MQRTAKQLYRHMQSQHPEEVYGEKSDAPKCETLEEWEKFCMAARQETPKQFYCEGCINTNRMYLVCLFVCGFRGVDPAPRMS
jgi:hypothetical protein